uniref:peptidylprolyl isomerase n=1 Tax=Trypanosoma congolense (strain IL3000) TaxID=1068625 RepID=G0UZX6_TRYCI|nr:conserved hypothetical protein [Trypanosoma congolense IL3000]
MIDTSDSSGKEGSASAERNLTDKRAKRVTAHRGMKSLFAEDDMQSTQGVTSLRYEDQSRGKAVARSLMGGSGAAGQPAGGSSPLQTAAQAPVIAYKGSETVGSCVVALCVPRTNAPANIPPLIAIIDREKHPKCRVRMDEDTQLIQSTENPQYASLYDPSFGGYWSLMFKGRRECTEFVAATLTAINSPRLQDNANPISFLEWDNGTGGDEGLPSVSKGDTVSVSFTSWLLRRVPGSAFFSLGQVVEEVPPEAPREVSLGNGTLMVGVEEALSGMKVGGASRLVFVPPRKTRVLRGLASPDVQPSDTVVTHITCHEVLRTGGGNRVPAAAATRGTDSSAPLRVDQAATALSAEVPMLMGGGDPPQAQPAAVVPQSGSSDINSLMQVLLVQTLQQQQQQQQPHHSGGVSSIEGGQLSSIERSVERLHLQLATLYEKIDRLGIDEKIEKNNAAIERIVKKVVGKVPMGDVDVEDAVKDRDGLLATIERLKGKLEEETANYHRALEAMSRHKDDVLQLQKDLQVQQETHVARVQQLEEDRRLRLVEAHVQQQHAVERVAEEKFQEGYNAGLRAAELKQKEQRALDPSGAGDSTVQEWRDRLFASEQRVLQLETALQQAEGHHISERRQLQEHIDALTKMTSMLQERVGGMGPEAQTLVRESATEEQCAILQRSMRAVCVNIETQLRAIGADKVPVLDVLHMLNTVTEAEVKAFSDEAARDAVLEYQPTAVTENTCAESWSYDYMGQGQQLGEAEVTGVVGELNVGTPGAYVHGSDINPPHVLDVESDQRDELVAPYAAREGVPYYEADITVGEVPEPPNLAIDVDDD